MRPCVARGLESPDLTCEQSGFKGWTVVEQLEIKKTKKKKNKKTKNKNR